MPRRLPRHLLPGVTVVLEHHQVAGDPRARYLRDAYGDLGGVSGMVRARRHFGGDLERILLSYHGRAFGFSRVTSMRSS